MYRTYFDKDTGAYLGFYSGPDESNPHAGHPSVEGQHDGFTRLVGGAPVREVPAPSYRDKRKAAYIAELGADPGDFVNTVGDVFDDVIRELAARGTPVTPEFEALVAKIAAIKLRHPKDG